MKIIKEIIFYCCCILVILPIIVLASESKGNGELELIAINNLWVILTAILTLAMQAGFAFLAAGLSAQKNTINVLFMSVMGFMISIPCFFLVGYGLMFGVQSFIGGLYVGLNGLQSPIPAVYGNGISLYAHFLFQLAFAATATTICSGMLIGRIKFIPYLIYSAFITAFIYPISGHWAWGGGWLSNNEFWKQWLDISDNAFFHDFAGSLVVHSVGAFAGLAGTIAVGARKGVFDYHKGVDRRDLLPHNLTLSVLGLFILWISWYGFNGGSTFGIDNKELIEKVAKICVNTTLAGAMAAIITLLLCKLKYKKIELSMVINGSLGGLVAITAPCAYVEPMNAIVIGAVAGVIVVFGVTLLIFLKIDDPVGAFTVHGLCGIWGGMSVAAFGPAHWLIQLIGCIVIPVWAFITVFALFKLLDVFMGIRVSEVEEIGGLDEIEHAESAYRLH